MIDKRSMTQVNNVFKRFGAFVVLFFLSLHGMSQSTVQLKIVSLPAYHASGSHIYVAGSFNGWNPSDEKFRMQQAADGKYAITLKLDAGKYEYKLTRGSWDNVECGKGGAGVDNRSIIVPTDREITLRVEEWQDRFPARPRLSTASRQVHIIDTAFWIPQLKRTRRIWIYLPKNYNAAPNTGDKFPVLYMHDGQNVFDESTSFSGEWGVDDFFDTTASAPIVVAIDNGGDRRLNEYNTHDNARFGKGEGNAYIDFIVKTLKPYIDKHYRTHRDRQHTYIAGSSMGGLISLTAILKYPKVFGGAGIFSPSIWISRTEILNDIKKKAKKVSGHIYFFAGKQEGETMVPNMLAAFEAFQDKSRARITAVIRDEGKHHESTWRKEFPQAYEWMRKAAGY